MILKKDKKNKGIDICLNCNYKCNGLYNKFVLQFPLPLGVKEKIF